MKWEWSKYDDKGLARFVTSDAANLIRLSQNRQDLALDSGDHRRLLVKEIYNTLLNLDKKIRYAPEIYHPSEAIQPIRTPLQIMSSPGEGTCLDLASFFCGLCLGNELLPLLIMLNNHALVAVSLNYGLRDWNAYNRSEKEFFKESCLTDINELCSLIDSDEYLAIESTGFAYSKSLRGLSPEANGRENGIMQFERAITAGREQLDQTDRQFRFALDIAIAHYEWRIEPIDEPPLSVEQALQKVSKQLNNVSAEESLLKIYTENIRKRSDSRKQAENWLEKENFRLKLASNIVTKALKNKSLDEYIIGYTKKEAKPILIWSLENFLAVLLQALKDGTPENIENFVNELRKYYPLGCYITILNSLKIEVENSLSNRDVINTLHRYIDILIEKIH